MKTFRKKMISLMLVALMLISAMPFSAFADETEETAESETVENVDALKSVEGTDDGSASFREIVVDVNAVVVVEGAGTGEFTSTKRYKMKSDYDATKDEDNKWKIAKAAIKGVGLPYADQYKVTSASYADGVFTVEVEPIRDSDGNHKCTSKTVKTEIIDNDDEWHLLRCQVCGEETKEQHVFSVTQNALYHEKKCSKCGYAIHVDHPDSMKDEYKEISTPAEGGPKKGDVVSSGVENYTIVEAATAATCKKAARYAKIKYDCGRVVGGEEHGYLGEHQYGDGKCVVCGKAEDDEKDYNVDIYLTRERSTPLISGTVRLTKSELNSVKCNDEGAAYVLKRTRAKDTSGHDQDIIDAYAKSIKDYFATMDVAGGVNIYVSDDISKTIDDVNAKKEITIKGALISNSDGYLVEDDTGYGKELYIGKSYFDQVKLNDPTGKRTLISFKITKENGGDTRIIYKSNTGAATLVQSDDAECQAVWSAKSVTVKFYRHPGSTDVLATVTMRAGQLIDNLPKLDGETVNWYLENNTLLQEGTVYYDFSKDVMKAYPSSNNDVYLFVYKNGDTTSPVKAEPEVISSRIQPSGVIDRSELTSIIEKVVGQKNLKIVGLFDNDGWTEYVNNKSEKSASTGIYVGDSSYRADKGPQFLYVMVNPNNSSKNNSKADGSNPKTGDNAQLGTAAAVMTVAIVGLGAATVVLKKKEII